MKKQKLVSFSPWLLAAACSMLAIIIAVFAVSNYQREKNLMLESLVRQGETIQRFVKAGIRGSMLGNRLNIRMDLWQWSDHVQQAIDRAIDQPDLLFIGLVNEQGKIVAGSGNKKSGESVPAETLAFLQEISVEPRDMTYFKRTQTLNNIHGVFQVASRYSPFGERTAPPRMMSQSMGMRGVFKNGKNLDDKERKFLLQLQDIQSEKYVLLVELDLKDFNSAMRRQLLQILFLSVVLLLVGLGGWLSLITLQGLKGSQARLQYMREFNDLLIASLPVGLISTGIDKTITLYNNSAELITGLKVKEVMGKDASKVLPESLSRELLHSPTTQAIFQPHEMSYADQDGAQKTLLLIALPVLDKENQFAGNTLLLQDVSQIKDLQNEVKRNERLAALGKMAAGVAHELRNPLSSIKGLALLLRAKVKEDDKGVETVDVLVNEVERLNRSIGELLEYARPDTLHFKPVHIEEVVKQAVRVLEADVKAEEITLSTEFIHSPVIMADADKLQQVFLNLMLNSIQAIDTAGEIHIRVYEAGKNCICEFHDNGKGISKDEIGKVFDPYFTTKGEGTGLGLSMSAKIIEAHKGQIEISSKKDTGTVVKVILQSA